MGEMPDGLACLILGGGGGVGGVCRASGLEWGPSVCKPSVRRGSPARVAGRVRSRPGTRRATHINQVGSRDDLRPSVVWKRVHVVQLAFNILENQRPVLLGEEGCGTTKVVEG